MSPRTSPHAIGPVGGGLIGDYVRGPGGVLRYEGPRPGPGWHRHDWRPRSLRVLRDGGHHVVLVERRRWRRAGTTATRVDVAPDEAGLVRAGVVGVLVAVAAWVVGGASLLEHRSAAVGSNRSVQRWRTLLAANAERLQGALRTAVIERSEPQPIESLFPGGLSPPVEIRRRRWKDTGALYPLVVALTFLVRGAVALKTSITVLVAEARRRLDAPLVIATT